jgi:hypothetical protein
MCGRPEYARVRWAIFLRLLRYNPCNPVNA